jgi:hypothetical protein
MLTSPAHLRRLEIRFRYNANEQIHRMDGYELWGYVLVGELYDLACFVLVKVTTLVGCQGISFCHYLTSKQFRPISFNPSICSLVIEPYNKNTDPNVGLLLMLIPFGGMNIRRYGGIAMKLGRTAEKYCVAKAVIGRTNTASLAVGAFTRNEPMLPYGGLQ